MAGRSTFEQVRAVTGTMRPPGTHSCKLVEVVPGLFTAHFHDFQDVRCTRLHDPGTFCTRHVTCPGPNCSLQADAHGNYSSEPMHACFCAL